MAKQIVIAERSVEALPFSLGFLILSMLTQIHFYAQLVGAICSAVVGLYAVFKILRDGFKAKKVT